METNEEMAKNAKETVLSLTDDSWAMLSQINPATEEVKSIKDIYVNAMQTYKNAFSMILSALEQGNVELMEEGGLVIESALYSLNEYNKALETLAESKGLTIEY